MQPYTIPDIIGANAVVNLKDVLPAGNPKKARMIMWCSQGGQAAVGDIGNVGAARGAHLTAAAQIVWPESKDVTAYYDLTLIAAYVPTGTQLTITYIV